MTDIRFTLLAETAPLAAFIIQGRRVCYANPAAETVLGIPRAELLAQEPAALFGTDHWNALRDDLAGLPADGAGDTRREICIRGRRGELRWIDCRMRPIEYEGAAAMLCVAMDITPWKQVQSARRDPDTTIPAMFEDCPYPVVIHCGGILQYVNRAGLALAGVDSWDGVRGRNLLEFVHPDDRDQSRLRIAETDMVGKVAPMMEVRLLRPDGRVVHVEAASAPMLYEGLPATLTIGHDVSAYRLMEGALRESEARNQAILNAIPDIIFCLNREGVILDFRSGRTEDFYVAPREFLGKSIYEVLPAELAQRLHGLIMAALDTERLQTFEYDLSMPVGPQYYEARIVAVGPDRVLGIVRNITESRLAEQTIAEQRVQLIEAAKLSLLGLMAGGIAHDVLSPLTVVYGVAEELRAALEHDKVDAAHLRELADQIARNAHRTTQMLKSLRNFARDASEDPFVTRRLQDIVEDALALTRQRFHKYDISLSVGSVPADLTVDCRPPQLLEVLLNLLNNAVDAARDASERWVRLDIDEDGGTVRIAVADSGAGVPSHVAARIFDPFFTTKPEGRGTGLGLSIAQRMVETHGGRLWLDPEHPKTRFVVELPRTQPAAGGSAST